MPDDPAPETAPENGGYRLEIDGVALPRPVAVFLVELVGSIPDDAILGLVKYYPGLARAYSVRIQNIPTFRERIRRDLAAATAVPAPLRTFLAEAALGGSLEAFSPEYLRAWYDELAAAVGEDFFLAGILLDPREEVRAIGLDRIRLPARRKGSPGGRKSRPAADSPMSALAPLVAPLMEAAMAGIPVDDVEEEILETEWEPVDVVDENLVRENETLGRRFAKAERDLERLRERLQREKDARNQAEKKAREEKALRKEAETARRKAEAGTDKLREQVGRLVDDAVKEALRQETLRWLRAPRNLEEASDAGAAADDVAVRARESLERQAERDRHFANRRALRARLDELDRLARELEDARSNALQPLPELRDAADRVAAETRRLRGLLGDDEPVAPVVASLLAELNACTSIAELQQLRRVVDALEEHELAARAELGRLRVAYRTVMSRLLDPYAPAIRAIEIPRDDPAWALVRALADRDPLGIVIDGHNLLYAMQELDPDRRDPVEHTRARTTLVERVALLVRDRPQCRATIFFDSSVHSREAPAPNVEVIYSGGTGEHRADAGIVEWLSHGDPVDRPRRMLVSSDRDLRIAAREIGALDMGSAEFSTFLPEQRRGQASNFQLSGA